ncbi:MAG: hypothetical protein DHS20C06_10700 [Hyphobacterium sp.]|nr:MAG: hypothetical protein DHS20C06_10700 [Hyphobacterium sp.]
MRILSGIIVSACLAFAGSAQDTLGDRSELSRIDACEDRDPGDIAPFLMECESHAGYRVMMAASEHSASLAFGDNGMIEQFGEHPQINGLYVALGPVIEWRHREGEATPYANIVRWRAITPVYDEANGVMTGEEIVSQNVLVVSALRPDGPVSACHVAYIDASEISGANEVAHRVAARYAPGFRCGQSEIMILDLFSAESLGLID